MPTKKQPNQASNPTLNLLTTNQFFWAILPKQKPKIANPGTQVAVSRLIASNIMPKHSPPNAPARGPSWIAQGNSHKMPHEGPTPLIVTHIGAKKVSIGANRLNAQYK